MSDVRVLSGLCQCLGSWAKLDMFNNDKKKDGNQIP